MALIFCGGGTRIVTDTAQIAYIDSNSFSISLPVGMNWTTYGTYYLPPAADNWKQNILFQACTNITVDPGSYAELEVKARIDTSLPRRLIIEHGGFLNSQALYWTSPGAVRPNISLQPGPIYASTFGATAFKHDIWENSAPSPCCGSGPPPPPPVDPPCGKLTENLCYTKQEDCCNQLSYDNPIYLGWYNSLGGWETWLFDCIYTSSIGVETIDKYNSYFNDIAHQDRRSISTRKKAFKKYALTSLEVTREEALALVEIFYSPVVKMWLGLDSVGNDKWIVVNIEDSDTEVLNTGITLQQFNLTITAPELFTISN